MNLSSAIFLAGSLILGASQHAWSAVPPRTLGGSDELEIQLLVQPAHAGSPDEQGDASAARDVFDAGEKASIHGLFAHARWDFRDDGTFTFDPGPVPGAVREIFPLQGTYRWQRDVLEIQAAHESPIGLSATLDGVLRKSWKGYRLDAVFSQRFFFYSQRLSRVRQRLRVGAPDAPPEISEKWVGGIPVPSVFHLTLEGSVDGQSLPPMPALLSIQTARKGSPYPLTVELISLSFLEEGTIQWPGPPPQADPEEYRVHVGDGRISIEAEASLGKQWVANWVKMVQLEYLKMPLMLPGDLGRLEIRVDGHQARGEIQISRRAGIGGYRGLFSGERWRGNAPLFTPSTFSSSLQMIYRKGAGDPTGAGIWELEDGSGRILGRLLLTPGEGNGVHGQLTTGNGTRQLKGECQGASLSLAESGTGTERWLLRIVPGSEVLIGLMRRSRWDQPRSVVARRIQAESPTPAETVESTGFGQAELDRLILAVSAGATGRCREARPLLKEVFDRNLRESSRSQKELLYAEASLSLLTAVHVASEMLAYCDLQIGDDEAFVSHLHDSVQILRSIHKAERRNFLVRSREEQMNLPVLQALTESFASRFSAVCRRRDTGRPPYGASLVEEIAAAGAEMESFSRVLREHSAAVQDLVKAVAEDRLRYREGIILLGHYREELREHVQRAFAHVATAGRSILAERAPDLLSQRDALWEALAEISGNQILDFSRLMRMDLSFRFNPSLSTLEKDLASEQFLSGSILLVIDKLLERDEIRLLLTPTLGLSLDAVQIATDLASRPETWRSRLRTDAGKIRSLERLQPFFSDLILFLLDEGRQQDALAVSEIARSRALLDLLVNKEGVRKGLEAFWERTGNSSLPSPVAVAPPTAEHVLDVIKWRGIATVEYFLTEDRLVIFPVSPDGTVSAISSPIDRQALRQMIDELRHLLTGRSTNDAERTHELLRELYRLLIEPIPADRLPSSTGEILTIIPHQELFGVPFAALEDGTGRPLVERFALTHGVSITTLGLMGMNRQKRQPGQLPRLLALVDPAPLPKGTDGRSLSPLSSLAEQFSSIAGFYPEKDRLVLKGTQATEAALFAKAGGADVLHLVTHAELVESDPLSSYIALAAGSGSQDGYLRVPEVFRMSLPADLVILWACETGRGGISADGIEGLSRGFIWAGAASMILSLWEIPAGESFVQMYGFHDLWLRQGQAKARALQQAQVEYRRLYPDQPGLWAGFVLYGEAE